MSLLGKILAILNVLGVLACAALAALDHGKRQTWAYANFLHDVAIGGLPLDANETDAEGQNLVAKLGEPGKADLFAGQGAPVATQLDEVNRYKAALDAAINANPDKKAQLVELARILTPLANSNVERERLRAIRANLVDAAAADKLKADILKAAAAAKDAKRQPSKPFEAAFAEELQQLGGEPRQPFADAFVKEAAAKPADQAFEDSLEQLRLGLNGEYEDAFRPAKEGQAVGASGSRSTLTPEERKAAIAALLFALTDPLAEIEQMKAGGQGFVPGQAWDVTQGVYKRYLTVVGLEAAGKAINRQAQVQARIASELAIELGRERTAFVATHQGLVNQLQLRAAQVAALGDTLARQQALLAEQQALVKRREQDIKLFQGELDKLSKETADRLAELRTMSDELYKVRVATRNAAEGNQKFEEKIRTLEQGK